jgi:hypothetical protein
VKPDGRFVGRAVGRAVGNPDGLAPVGRAHAVLVLLPVPPELELLLLEHAVITPVAVTPARAIAPTRSASGLWSRIHVLLFGLGSDPRRSEPWPTQMRSAFSRS